MKNNWEYDNTGKMLAVEIEYGIYDSGRNCDRAYDDVLYEFIQNIGGNYTTDLGMRPKYLYLFDGMISKEELALAVMRDMSYPIYLKENINTDEDVIPLIEEDLLRVIT